MVLRQDARISHAESNAFLLSTALPDFTQKRLAGGVLAAFVLFLLVTIPFARIQPNGTEILLPAYAAAYLPSSISLFRPATFVGRMLRMRMQDGERQSNTES